MAILTPEGVEHGLIRRLKNSVSVDKCKREGKDKSEFEKKKEHDSKKVTARYLNHQNQISGQLMKPYVKYAGDPIEIYKFLSGFAYEVPMGLVEEVNSSYLEQRSKEDHQNGNTKISKDRKEQKIHEFVPVGF